MSLMEDLREGHEMRKGMPNENDMPEFAGQIIDMFEDWLDKNGITLINAEREDYLSNGEFDDPSEAAWIYGTAYCMLEDAISRETEEACTNKDLETAAENIIDAFSRIMKEGGHEEDIPEADVVSMKNRIRDTFEKWNII